MADHSKKIALIAGAGPAGLTAALELLERTDIIPVILEKTGDIGGISKTVNYKGNRMDIGGHRFFSKSERVMQWWLRIQPLAPDVDRTIILKYQNKTTLLNPGASASSGSQKTGLYMLVRKRVSHIYYLKKFFSYPITLSWDTLSKLGLVRMIRIAFSYLWIRLFPRKNERSLEDFFINRFGWELYRTFFKDYTEKVWGIPCAEIPAEWGAQRIKGLSITRAIKHALKTNFRAGKNDLGQEGTETSLIQQFLYPRLGPGQLWEEVARRILEKGGSIHFFADVERVDLNNPGEVTVTTRKNSQSDGLVLSGHFLFSTMPVVELINAIGDLVPANVRAVANGLLYRDFITVGILLKKLNTKQKIEDNWIYIQDRAVLMGRLQIFNNWSPDMVADPNNTWVGLEYFCNTTDAFWQLPDEQIATQAMDELQRIGLADKEDLLDYTVIRMEKTYPAYFGTYDSFPEIRKFTDQFSHLFLIGRNGMHKYNNADHSMLTAMVAVDNIIAGKTDKANIWKINTEQDYHE